MRIGLASNRLHHARPDSILFRLIREWEGAIRTRLRPELLTVGRTHAALLREGCLLGYEGLVAYPYGRDGGLMRLASRLVDDDAQRALDAMIYLIDPTDPSSVFPEAAALKRQCVIHGKPFVSTLAGAREFFELHHVAAGGAPSAALDGSFDFSTETIALVAHDACKARMVAFVETHFELLAQFAVRIGTGTTGGLLNEVARRRGVAHAERWVTRLKSGPLGGDAQIAEWLLDRRCRRVIFFEDPHVARQHEADIQLLERAARVVSDYALCISEPRTAEWWVHACSARHAAASQRAAAC